MICERIGDDQWPAVVTVGESWYGLRIEHDDGTSEVHYLSTAPRDRQAECPHATAGARDDYRTCSVCVHERTAWETAE